MIRIEYIAFYNIHNEYALSNFIFFQFYRLKHISSVHICMYVNNALKNLTVKDINNIFFFR